MPQLRCSAASCIHNNDECCCRGEIDVAGTAANCSDDTCCASFYEDNGGARNAVNQSPMTHIDVTCKAENCVHNDNCCCHADCIDVNGYGANQAGETACSTFCPS